MKWDLNNDQPIYQQIVVHMEKAVIANVYPPGSRLPTVRDLAAEAGVNPNTMQRALAELESSGLFNSQRTSGRYVTEDVGYIKQLRGEIAEKHTDEYLSAMGQLKYDTPEIIEFIRGRTT